MCVPFYKQRQHIFFIFLFHETKQEDLYISLQTMDNNINVIRELITECISSCTEFNKSVRVPSRSVNYIIIVLKNVIIMMPVHPSG
jgi:hypothetical protein